MAKVREVTSVLQPLQPGQQSAVCRDYNKRDFHFRSAKAANKGQKH